MNIRKIIRKAVHRVMDGKDETRPTYAAVLVDDPKEIRKIDKMVRANMKSMGIDDVPFSWRDPKHYHMTVKMGRLPLGVQMRGDVNRELELHAKTIGVSDDALALGVEGYFSKNDLQHITIRFRERPSDSNNITNWTPLQHPFTIVGRVTQFT